MKWIVGLLLGVVVGVLVYSAMQKYMLDAKNAQG
jgi:hypothetical protein